MHDPLVVSSRQGVRKRGGDVEDLRERHAARCHHAVERVAFDQLHRDETVAVRFFDAEDSNNVGVVEGGYCDRLSFESFKSFRT